MTSPVRKEPQGLGSRGRWAVALALVYAAEVLALVIWKPAGPIERDAFYHARFAELLPERGLSRAFPWLEASTLRERFCDKEFLYHVLLVPFTRGASEPLAGAVLFQACLALACLAAIALVLRAQGAPRAWFFALLPLCMGAPFLSRLIMVRSHVLSMVLMVVGLHLLCRGRWRALLVLGFLYAWSYTVPLALVMTAAAFCVGRRLGGGAWDWRSPAAAALGVVAGLVVHPYSPLTLETFLTYVDVVRTGLAGAARARVELGNEIYPPPWDQVLENVPLFVASVLALVALFVAKRRALAPETVGAVAAALGWTLMSAFFLRFLEYAVPLAALALGLAARDLAPGASAARRWRRAGLVSVLLVAALAHLWTLRVFWVGQSRSPWDRYERVGAWMSANLAEGETVANLWWTDFPELFYHAPHQRYLWGLDPTYTLRFDEELGLWLERMRLVQEPLDGARLERDLHARYLFLPADVVDFYPSLHGPAWSVAYRDEHAALFRSNP